MPWRWLYFCCLKEYIDPTKNLGQDENPRILFQGEIWLIIEHILTLSLSIYIFIFLWSLFFLPVLSQMRLKTILWVINWAVSSSCYVWFFTSFEWAGIVDWGKKLLVIFYPVSCSMAFLLIFPLAMYPQMLLLSFIALFIEYTHKFSFKFC